MNSSLRGPLFFCALAFFALPVAAQVPKTEAETPIYPGAVRDAALEARRQAERKEEAEEERASRARERAMDGTPSARALSSSIKVYRVNASVEDVMRFYRQRLDGKTEYGDEMDSRNLAPGQTTPVVYGLVFYEDQIGGGIDQNTEGFECFGRAEASVEVRPLMAARAPAEPGKWIAEASWWWFAKNLKGNPMYFRVGLLDVGISKDCKSWSPRTLIEVSVDVYQSEEQVAGEEQEFEGQEDRAHQQRVAGVAAKPPTEPELGMPIYPGARFDPELSTGLSQESEKYYVYFTDDPILKVVQFYEGRTGKKAIELEGAKGAFWVVLKGTAPWPELGVLIEPAAGKFGARPADKTVVSVRKVVARRPDESPQ